VSRGWIIAIVLAVVIAALYFWIIPEIKQRYLGDSMQVHYKILNAADDRNVPYKGNDTGVARTIVDMELYFPMGSAPESTHDLEVTGDDGKPVEVNWPPDTEATDLPSERTTKWILKDVYFPYGWRVGTLRNKYRDLCTIKLVNVQSN